MKKKLIVCAVALIGMFGLTSAGLYYNEGFDGLVGNTILQLGGSQKFADDIVNNHVAYDVFTEFDQRGAQSAVDQLACHAVNLGYAKDNAEAKRLMKQQAEKIRKDDRLCQKIYNWLGL